MSNRRLVAALACRAEGSRLYGKPLQNLAPDYTILDHILTCIAGVDEISEAVLGIANGAANLPFIDVAAQHGLRHITGDEKDVLWRLVECGRAGSATDVFRITTECPFTIWELLPEAWERHVGNGNDITVVDRTPEGVHFEIYKQETLERSHREGLDGDRSEYASNYARLNQSLFDIEIILPDAGLQRMDIRLTVDYPEDLVLCRRVYEALKEIGPRIPIASIIEFLDKNPSLTALVEPYVVAEPLWDGVVQREAL